MQKAYTRVVRRLANFVRKWVLQLPDNYTSLNDMNRFVPVWRVFRQVPADLGAAELVAAGADDVIDDDVLAPAAVVDVAHAQVGGGDDGKSRAAAWKSLGACGASQRIAEVRMRIVLAGQRDVTTASGRQQLALFAVAPFHASVLEPDFHLRHTTWQRVHVSTSGLQFHRDKSINGRTVVMSLYK